ncbi:MAG TPA: glycosyltransferase family 87 protein [Acidobacteriaceae bacterium]|nr:glycosyltransferase family 87 protein [Acidobacteriaceae bacterium]
MASADPQDKFERTASPLPQILRMFWLWSLIAFVAMIVIGYVEFRMGYPKPHYSPLGGSRFDDLTEYLPTYRLLHTAAFFGNPESTPVAYPPFGAVMYALDYASGHAVGFYLATALVWLAAAVWGVRRALIKSGIGGLSATLFPLTLVLLSFPIAGLIQRGNIELFLWIFAACGTWAFVCDKDDAAAVLWGLAAAMKLYPIIFLALLLPRRKYRAFAVGVGTFVVASIASMAWLGPRIAVAWKGSLHNVFGYQGVRVSEWSIHELAANHSMYGLAKIVAIGVNLPVSKLMLPYYAMGAVVFGLLFFRRLWKMPMANQLLAVSAFMVMLPPVSYFYTLVHLYAPWLVLAFIAIRADRAGVRIPGLQTTILLFVPLFGSFMLFTYPRVMLFGGIVQCCVLILLFLCAVTFPFTEDRAQTPEVAA